MSTPRRIDVAREGARAGADVASGHFRTTLSVEHKTGKTDVVTIADRDAQRAVINSIKSTYPEETIVGEEEDVLKTVPSRGETWVIDPIDGTNNYVRGTQVWATAVAAVTDAEPTVGVVNLPELGDEYWTDTETAYRNGEQINVSEKTDPAAGIVAPTLWWDFDSRKQYGRACQAILDRFGDLRRIGSAQATLAGVAAGIIDGAITNLQANPWDTLAGVALVRAAGGRVTDVSGDHWQHDSDGLVASNGYLHAETLTAAQNIRPTHST
jgi:myo-inositol-1(or 4)-monophosphatase